MGLISKVITNAIPLCVSFYRFLSSWKSEQFQHFGILFNISLFISLGFEVMLVLLFSD